MEVGGINSPGSLTSPRFFPMLLRIKEHLLGSCGEVAAVWDRIITWTTSSILHSDGVRMLRYSGVGEQGAWLQSALGQYCSQTQIGIVARHQWMVA